jgi:hypothetical protein
MPSGALPNPNVVLNYKQPFWMQNSTQSWESATAVAIASLPITLKSAFQMRRTRIGAAYGLRVPLAALGALTLMMLHAKVNKNQDRE